MTIASSGQVSLADIQNEYGGSNPIGINEYFSGGSYVPSSTYSPTAGTDIPSSSTISFNNFRGTTKFTGATHDYSSGSGTETVPTGARSLTVYCVGPGGQGGVGYYGGDLNQYGGGGGGAGGIAISVITISSGNWGSGISYAVGAPNTGTSTVSGLGMSLTSNHGDNGGSAQSGSVGVGGTGGTASGGNSSNSTGSPGNQGDSNGDGGVGGNGYSSTSWGAGGNGGAATGSFENGAYGHISFVWG